VTTERLERARRIRKKIREAVPSCIAVVDHGDYMGAYFYPEDMPEAQKIIAASEWEGVPIHVRPTPPLEIR
jgi:hypothetical protein